MGSCGCGNYAGEFKLKGPNNTWYIIEKYPGCDYCDTPMGVVIYHFTDESAKQWDVENLPDLAIMKYSRLDVDGEGIVKLIHGEKLADSLKKITCKASDLDSQDCIGLLRTAFFKTQEADDE